MIIDNIDFLIYHLPEYPQGEKLRRILRKLCNLKCDIEIFKEDS